MKDRPGSVGTTPRLLSRNLNRFLGRIQRTTLFRDDHLWRVLAQPTRVGDLERTIQTGGPAHVGRPHRCFEADLACARRYLSPLYRNPPVQLGPTTAALAVSLRSHCVNGTRAAQRPPPPPLPLPIQLSAPLQLPFRHPIIPRLHSWQPQNRLLDIESHLQQRHDLRQRGPHHRPEPGQFWPP